MTEKTSRIKVLHIVAGAGKGGAETFCLDAIKALDDAGVAQHVICRPHDHYLDTFRQRNIPFSLLSFSHVERFSKASGVIRGVVADFQPDLAHSWMGRASSFIPSGLKIPVLGWFGGYYDLKRYRNCDYFAGVTKDIVRHIIGESDKPHRSFLIHTFGTLEDSPPVTRAELNVPDDAKTVLLLSRMHWKKGVDTLLQAAQKLPAVHFLLAGDGPDLEKYKTMAAELGVKDRAHFLGWRNDRAALLKIADICVLPSRYEPFGTVIAESWFANVPLVAARADGARQYVTHNSDGLLCDIDDADGLAEQINRVLTDPALRGSLVRNGRETYLTTFSKDIVTRTLIGTYDHIITIGKPTPAYIVAKGGIRADMAEHLQDAVKACAIPATAQDREDALLAASAYMDHTNDPDMAFDVAYLQLKTLFDFRKKSAFIQRDDIAFLTRAEIALILSNAQNSNMANDYPKFIEACTRQRRRA